MSFVPDRAFSSSSSSTGSAFTLDPISDSSAPAASQRSNENDDSALDPQTTQGPVKFDSVSGNEVAPDPRAKGEQELISHDVNHSADTATDLPSQTDNSLANHPAASVRRWLIPVLTWTQYQEQIKQGKINPVQRSQGELTPSLQETMRTLLEYPSTALRKVPFRAYCEQVQHPIQVIKKDDSSSYTLVPSYSVMSHWRFSEHICNLYPGTSGKCFDSLDVIKTIKKVDNKPDVFIPLGWLAEQASHHVWPTRFVCLWNVSTKPNSLWLAYDCQISNSFVDPDAMETEPGKMECYHRYDDYGMLPGREDVQGLKDLRVKATFKLFRGAKRSGTGMIDIGMIIEDVGQWDDSVGVPFENALASLRITRRQIGSELHAINVPSAWRL